MTATVVVTLAGFGANVTSAATLQFSTAGTFTSPVGVDSNAAANIVTIGDSTLTYSAIVPVNSNSFNPGDNFDGTVPGFVGFGTFSLTSGTSGLPDVFTTTSFALSITQIAPVPTPNTPATIIATLLGTITVSTDGVRITFAAPSTAFTVASTTPAGVYTYTVDSNTVVGVGQTKNIGGIINLPQNAQTIAPLPPAALGGVGLSALLFGFRRLKQRVSSL